MGERIAIVTGATGGIGREFVRQLLDEDIDRIWAVARNEEKLSRLCDDFGERVVPLPADLSSREGLAALTDKLGDERPNVRFLVNNAGIARMGSCGDFSLEEIEATVKLNCTAMVALCAACIPYIERGGRILNISSASAFQPTPYLSLYAATKAFERSYSRALNAELKGSGVVVCTVCPSWVDTELLTREVNGRRVVFPGLVAPSKVAKLALRDARKGRDQSIHPLYAKYLHVAAKLLPAKLVMSTWMHMLKRYER